MIDEFSIRLTRLTCSQLATILNRRWLGLRLNNMDQWLCRAVRFPRLISRFFNQPLIFTPRKEDVESP